MKLLDIGELEHAAIHANPEHPEHAQWVTCLMNMQAMRELGRFQELCTDPCNVGSCIIMLQHEVMVADKYDNGPQNLFTVSLCVQTAINKMHVCSLSTAYACPYHNPDEHADELP